MSRLRTGVVGAAALAVTFGMAACGNGAPVTGSSSGSGSSGTACDGSAGATVSGTVGSSVQQTDALKFNPNHVSISVGQVVKWTNGSNFPHNVTFASCSSFTSQTMQNGDSWEVVFNKAGSYSYSCTIHPGMDGVVVVS